MIKLSTLFFSLFLFICSTSMFAQNISEIENRIEQIRQMYKEVNKNIKKDAFLTDKIEVNTDKKPEFPAVGIYDKEITAHYTVGTGNDPLEKVFRRVYILHHYSAYQSSTEYIFDERGILAFIFYKTGEGNEYRFYFDKEKTKKIVRLIADKKTTNNPTLDKETSQISKHLIEQQEKIITLLQTL